VRKKFLPPQALYGSWKEKFPEQIDIEKDLKEIRSGARPENETFQQAVTDVLKKNAELYRRLA
jgi:hypothetical protein